MKTSISERTITLAPGLAPIPERLLLAHARGEVLFITGAGISMPSDAPSFRGLVLDIYEMLDKPVFDVINRISESSCSKCWVDDSSLSSQQQAEVHRFIQNEYDVVLGMLERRIDGPNIQTSQVRTNVQKIIECRAKKPSLIHQSLVRLANRGVSTSLVTTNFDLLLEYAARNIKVQLPSYSMGGIPRPSRRKDFEGILHIHGSLRRASPESSDIVLTDHDFGEFYLRRRIIPDFIYDAARLFHIVLVGYSANDAPMRYLLNAVAADGSRFDDLKERYTFTHVSDQRELADWRSRGITPIPYDKADNHQVLSNTLERWSRISTINGKTNLVDRDLKRITKKKRVATDSTDRDLFDHYFRRGDLAERRRMADLITRAKASVDWFERYCQIWCTASGGIPV